MLADLFLQFCAMSFCFTGQDKKEMREKEKEKDKKMVVVGKQFLSLMNQQTREPAAAYPRALLLCTIQS
jgi:hypothetical protein